MNVCSFVVKKCRNFKNSTFVYEDRYWIWKRLTLVIVCNYVLTNLFINHALPRSKIIFGNSFFLLMALPSPRKKAFWIKNFQRESYKRETVNLCCNHLYPLALNKHGSQYEQCEKIRTCFLKKSLMNLVQLGKSPCFQLHWFNFSLVLEWNIYGNSKSLGSLRNPSGWWIWVGWGWIWSNGKLIEE